MAKIVCVECRIGPLNGRALYRKGGTLFGSTMQRYKGKGPLYCARCAPDMIKARIMVSTVCDEYTRWLASASSGDY